MSELNIVYKNKLNLTQNHHIILCIWSQDHREIFVICVVEVTT